MSAIAGYLLLNGGRAEQGAVRAMSALLAHRGPDGEASVSDGPFAVACRLHRTTPEPPSGELAEARGRYLIATDARLDNREAVGRGLGWQPRETAERSDGALILEAFVRRGRDAFRDLIGDFAVAIWDRDTSTLTCARDPFGVRPLYYHRGSTVFAFASEPKALFALDAVPKRLNEAKLVDYLALLREDDYGTIYQGVSLLGPGETLTVNPEGATTAKYYELTPQSDLAARPVEDLVDGFRAHFTEAVERCTRSTVPVGSHLSGGLDSSAVVCVARDVMARRGARLHTFSAVYDSVPTANERPFIEAVVEQGGVEAHFIEGDKLGPLANLDRLYTTLDDEPVGGNQHIPWALMACAREQGVGVMLDGLDGDNVVGHGIQHLHMLAREGRWAEFAQLAPGVAGRFGSDALLQPFQRSSRSIGGLFAQYGYPALSEFALERQWRRLIHGYKGARRYLGVSRPQLLRALVRPVLTPGRVRQRAAAARLGPHAGLGLELVAEDLARRTDLAGRIEAAGHSSLHTSDVADLRETHRQVLMSPRFTRAMTLTNLAAGAFSIESRHPFLYRPLVEYCLGLPPELSLRHGWTRYVLRAALRDVLPEMVATRSGKADITAAFVHGLTTYDAERLERWVRDPGPFGQFVKVDRLVALHQRAMAARPDATSAERTLLTQIYATYKLLERKGLV